MPITITDNTFINETNEGLVLVDFFGAWCSPCQALLPVLEKLEEELSEKIKIVKIDVDENPKTAQSFGVISVPTLILKKNNEVVKRVTGLHSKSVLLDLISEHI
ncbi:thioredoxin [Bacilli bacterium]|nr:thioredoxin [Bacilli bacterium]GHU44194.1 thioredoxin [Bacilli bacterium]